MFEVELPKEFVKADGKPFKKAREDKEGKPVQQVSEGKPVFLPDGKGNMLPQWELENASYLDMLTVFLNNLFELVAAKSKEGKDGFKSLKLEDSSFATDCFRAIHVVVDGKIELEKAPYEWLTKMLTEYGVDVFGLNTAVMIEPIKKAQEGTTNRAERKRIEKG